MAFSRQVAVFAVAAWFGLPAVTAQTIEFDSGGLKFRTQTRQGLTIMFAPLPSGVRNYAVLQVAVANGSQIPCVIRPEDFSFQRQDGTVVRASPARQVVMELIEKAGRSDVIKLVSIYEIGLYGMNRISSTNGYEQRRQAAFAEVSSTKIKAAAAASAIAFVQTQLPPGQSTDGAVFFASQGRPLGLGKLMVRAAGQTFEFDVTDDPPIGTLKTRPPA
jgi:hypothetical protein